MTQSTWYNNATKQDVIYADLYVDKDNSGDYSAGDTGLYAEIWADYYNVEPITVTFFGVADDETGDLDTTNANTIEVSYATAAANKTGVKVSGDVKKTVLVNNGSSTPVDLSKVGVSKTAVTYTLTVTDTADNVYVYTLKQNAITTDTGLYLNGVSQNTITEWDGATTIARYGRSV